MKHLIILLMLLMPTVAFADKGPYSNFQKITENPVTVTPGGIDSVPPSSR